MALATMKSTNFFLFASHPWRFLSKLQRLPLVMSVFSGLRRRLQPSPLKPLEPSFLSLDRDFKRCKIVHNQERSHATPSNLADLRFLLAGDQRSPLTSVSYSPLFLETSSSMEASFSDGDKLTDSKTISPEFLQFPVNSPCICSSLSIGAL